MTPRFMVGKRYRGRQLAGKVWPGIAPDYDSWYVRRLDENGHPYFELEADPSPHSLVPAESAQPSVEELLRRGLDLNAIACSAGISVDAARRAAAGFGHVRRSTREKPLAMNGNGTSGEPAVSSQRDAAMDELCPRSRMSRRSG